MVIALAVGVSACGLSYSRQVKKQDCPDLNLSLFSMSVASSKLRLFGHLVTMMVSASLAADLNSRKLPAGSGKSW